MPTTACNISHSWMCCWNEWRRVREIDEDAVGDIFRLGGYNCSCCSVSVCILFHLLVSLMHQVYINIFCIRHQLLPEFSFHQLPENFHSSASQVSQSLPYNWCWPVFQLNQFPCYFGDWQLWWRRHKLRPLLWSPSLSSKDFMLLCRTPSICQWLAIM